MKSMSLIVQKLWSRLKLKNTGQCQGLLSLMQCYLTEKNLIRGICRLYHISSLSLFKSSHQSTLMCRLQTERNKKYAPIIRSEGINSYHEVGQRCDLSCFITKIVSDILCQNSSRTQMYDNGGNE